jgi:hypothetical protein
MNKSLNWRDLSLGTKLPLSVFLVVSLVFAAFVAAIGYSVSNMIEARANAEVTEKTKVIVDLIDAFDKDRRARWRAGQDFSEQDEGRLRVGVCRDRRQWQAGPNAESGRQGGQPQL